MLHALNNSGDAYAASRVNVNVNVDELGNTPTPSSFIVNELPIDKRRITNLLYS